MRKKLRKKEGSVKRQCRKLCKLEKPSRNRNRMQNCTCRKEEEKLRQIMQNCEDKMKEHVQ